MNVQINWASLSEAKLSKTGATVNASACNLDWKFLEQMRSVGPSTFVDAPATSATTAAVLKLRGPSCKGEKTDAQSDSAQFAGRSGMYRSSSISRGLGSSWKMKLWVVGAEMAPARSTLGNQIPGKTRGQGVIAVARSFDTTSRKYFDFAAAAQCARHRVRS